MRRWRQTISTAMAVTIVVAMALGFGLQRAVDWSISYWDPPQEISTDQESPWQLQALSHNIAVLLRVLDTTPNTERPTAIAAVQRPHYRIWLVDAPIKNLVNRADANADTLRRRIQAFLVTPHPLIVADWNELAGQNAGSRSGRFRNGSVVEAQLADGHWVVFEFKLRPPPPTLLPAPDSSWLKYVAWAAMCVVLAMLFSLVLARWIVRPMSELSAAIEQLGGSGEAPAIRPQGPREVVALTLAFNRMQERLRRFNDDRTRMFASMSHDLRTPLTRLRLRTEMLDGLAEQQKMLAELDTTNEMIESILSFAREETQREPRSLVDLSALVEAICEDASDSGEPVTFDGPRAVTISCRPTALRRAISNLVDNAIKYGKIALVTLSPGPEHVTVTVDDEGPGIPWNEREKVFEPFYRMDSSRNPNTGGVGLGLCVTRSIVWEHGGEIVLANRKGGGLSIRLKLPASVSQQEGPQERTQKIDLGNANYSHVSASSIEPA